MSGCVGGRLPGRPLTRRQALALGICVAGGLALGLSGCSGGKSDLERFRDGELDAIQGYAADTEVRSYPVELRLYADANLKWEVMDSVVLAELGYEATARLDGYEVRYRAQADRNQITFDVRYLTPTKLEELARDGFGDVDGVIALPETIEAGNVAGTIDGGEGGWMVRSLNFNLDDTLVVARPVGSDVELPPAETLDGEDSSDGVINRLQQLPSFAGTVALADPETTTEGRYANRCLYFASHYYARDTGEDVEYLYSEEDGTSGEYSEGLFNKIVLFATQDEAVAAVMGGECDACFALYSQIGTRYPDLEEIYRPQYGSKVSYHAAATSEALYPGVARDFFEFITGQRD